MIKGGIRKLIVLILSLSIVFGNLSITNVDAAVSSSDNQTEFMTGYVDLSDEVLQVGGYLDATSESVQVMSVSLTQEERRENLKKLLMNAWDSFDTTCDVSGYGITVDDLEAVYAQALNDDYRYFYVSSGYSYKYTTSGEVVSVIIYYNMAEDEAKVKLAALETAVAEALYGADASWSDMEKALYINDYLARNCEYDTTYTKYSAYDALVNKTAVCQGYALAYKILANELGLTCEIVTSDSLNHAWNIVKIGDYYYHVDTTWNDPMKDHLGRARHLYFMKSSEFFNSADGKHQASDWVIGGDIADTAASDTSYDSCFWNDIDTGFEYVNGYWYGIDDTYICEYTCEENKFIESEKIKSVDAVWNVLGSSAYWPGSYASLASYNDVLYYSLTDAIYELDLSTGESSVIYTLTEELKASGYIYGMRILSDGNVEFLLATGPNTGCEVGTYTATRLTGEQVSLSNCTATLGTASYTYDGTAKIPEVTVKNGNTVLVGETDYTVSYSNNINAGTATVTITGKGNYTGTITKTFTIEKASQTVTAIISSSDITVGSTATITANGVGTITYTSGSTGVATVSSSGTVTGVSAGTAVITVTASGNSNYNAGTTTVTVIVKAAEPVKTDLSACTVTLGTTSYTYDTTAKKPSVNVKDGTKTLVNGTDYTVTYTDNINTGTATVTVAGKGNYTGTVKKTFTITATGKCGDSATWTFNSRTGAFTVTGTGDMYDYQYSTRTPWFKFKTQIKTVSIGSGITSVGTNAFYGCTSLTKVTGCAGVTFIGINSFRNCTALTSVAGCTKVKTVSQYAFCGSTGFATLGSTTGTVSLPAATWIGGYAFYQCKGIKILNTYSPLTYMGTSSFRNCTSLTKATVGAGCKTIASYAFCGDTALTSVAGCAGVTGIGAYAFWGDTSLTTVAGMSSVTSVGNYGFYNCAKLMTVGWISGRVLFNSIKGIGNYAFAGCKALTSFTAGANLTQIGTYAFNGDAALATIYLKTTKLATVGTKVFNGIKSTGVIYVPSSKLTAYKNGILKGKGQPAAVTIKAY